MKLHLLAISPGRGFEAGRWDRVLSSGIQAFMIRERELPARRLLELARWCRARAPQVELWVNGRLDVALAAGCGLHAPEAYPELPPGLLSLSRPLHQGTPFEARRNADQLLLSPVFAVPGKGPALGAPGLHRWLDGLPPSPARLLALGGIGPENAAMLRHPRLAGVAVIRALWDAEDPAGAVARLREAWER